MNSNVSGIVYRDVITAIMAIFVLLTGLMLSFLAEPRPSIADQGLESPGSISVVAAWPEGDTDVDLWLTAPGEPLPVFYQNRGGKVWDLLRDDLGTAADSGPLNYENAFTRGAPEGEYRINLVCFKCYEPVEVSVEVQEKGSGGLLTDVSRTKVLLRKTGDERTALAFEVGPTGSVKRDTMNTFFRSIKEQVSK